MIIRSKSKTSISTVYIIYIGFTTLFMGEGGDTDHDPILNTAQNFGKRINQNARGTNFQDKKTVLLGICNNIIVTSVFSQDPPGKNSIFVIGFTAYRFGGFVHSVFVFRT